MKGGRTSKRR